MELPVSWRLVRSNSARIEALAARVAALEDLLDVPTPEPEPTPAPPPADTPGKGKGKSK